MAPSAAFVLAGGQSLRMGRDKALLPLHGRPLLDHVCRTAAAAAGAVTIIGGLERYAYLGWEIFDEDQPGQGPLGGIVKALSLGRAELNLVCACDMPLLNAALLQSMFQSAHSMDELCLLPITPDGRAQPLCAIYRAAALPGLAEALGSGRLKMREALASLPVLSWQVLDQQHFMNLNVPADCEALGA
jgi:molybdopterin-guanine dinucleotide biosynthesis protein A